MAGGGNKQTRCGRQKWHTDCGAGTAIHGHYDASRAPGCLPWNLEVDLIRGYEQDGSRFPVDGDGDATERVCYRQTCTCVLVRKARSEDAGQLARGDLRPIPGSIDDTTGEDSRSRGLQLANPVVERICDVNVTRAIHRDIMGKIQCGFGSHTAVAEISLDAIAGDGVDDTVRRHLADFAVESVGNVNVPGGIHCNTHRIAQGSVHCGAAIT